MNVDSFLHQCRQTLSDNTVETLSGPVLLAGQHQFATFWVRDFCWSVPGLILNGQEEVARRGLELLLEARDRDGFLPRSLDCLSTKARVVLSTLGISSPTGVSLYRRRKLRVETHGEHGTPAFDSNLLWWIAAAQAAPDLLISETSSTVLSVYRDYQDSQGWLRQPAFSDWQDSAAREGVYLLTQLLLLRALRLGLEVGVLTEHQISDLLGGGDSADPLAVFRQRIRNEFARNELGLYREQRDQSRICLDSQFLVLEELLAHHERSEFWRALRQSPVWKRGLVPGVPTSEPYSGRERAWTTRLIGLGDYHDGVYWGWLGAEAARWSWIMGDHAEGERILKVYAEASDVPSEIYEVRGGTFVPVARILYRSEQPFSWTAARWLVAEAARNSSSFSSVR